MYADTVEGMADQAAAKLAAQRQSIVSHFVRSMLAGMYVGVMIVLIFTIGGSLAGTAPHLVKLLMGLCFGGALTLVIFAGSELFTGSNLVLTLGVLTRKARWRELGANWTWTWLGNLAGSVLLAVLVVRSGVLSAEPIQAFVLKVVEGKMTIPVEQLLIRAILANWLVCLAVWMAGRTKSDTAKLVLIWYCMFTFITAGFEHSVANMCGLLLGLLLPHEAAAGITWTGYAYNLSVVTVGNIIGGAVFVGGMYWLGSPTARQKVRQAVKGSGTAPESPQAGADVVPAKSLAYSPDAPD